jgi:hypothetical protein
VPVSRRFLAGRPASNVYAAGISYNNAASPVIAGTALYAHKMNEAGTYAFSVFDALPSNAKPFTVQSSVSAGVAQKVFSIGSIPIFAPTAAGVSFNGQNTGWAWSTGALASISFKGKYRIMPGVRVLKSSVGGADINPSSPCCSASRTRYKAGCVKQPALSLSTKSHLRKC